LKQKRLTGLKELETCCKVKLLHNTGRQGGSFSVPAHQYQNYLNFKNDLGGFRRHFWTRALARAAGGDVRQGKKSDSHFIANFFWRLPLLRRFP
jgi:hypothetical protein